MSARTYGLTRITVIESFGGYCYGSCGSKENRQKQDHTLQTLFSAHTIFYCGNLPQEEHEICVESLAMWDQRRSQIVF